MTTISQLRKNSNQIVANLNTIIATLIEDNDKKLIELNQQQLKNNKNADGKKITPDYSAAYARKKGYKKVDGYLSGEMYQAMDAVVDENQYTYNLTSFSESAGFFAWRYGNIVFGISPKNLKPAQKYYTNLLALEYKRRMAL
jgi:hypothetical protein